MVTYPRNVSCKENHDPSQTVAYDHDHAAQQTLKASCLLRSQNYETIARDPTSPPGCRAPYSDTAVEIAKERPLAFSSNHPAIKKTYAYKMALLINSAFVSERTYDISVKCKL